MAARFDRRAGVQAAAVAVVVVLAIAWAVYKHGEPMGRDELRIQAQELVSQAAEGGALLELAGHRHVNERFRQEHLQQLREHAMETEARLRDSTFEAPFAMQGQQLRKIAHALSSALRSPDLAPGVLEQLRSQAHAVDEALPKDPP
jgi:hypothetical protein